MSEIAGITAQLKAQCEAQASAGELLGSLQALQRLGLTEPDLQVMVERWRAVNEATDDNETLEDTHLDVLDMITGWTGGPMKLTWPAGG